MLAVNIEKIDLYFQRSWATISRQKERIQPHSHDQSNISFAYYPLKPKDSGDIKFILEPPNEIAKGLFAKEQLDLGLLKSINIRNAPNVDLYIEAGPKNILQGLNRRITNKKTINFNEI